MYTVIMNDRGVLFESDNKDEAYSQFRAATVLARHPHGFATGRNVILKDQAFQIMKKLPTSCSTFNQYFAIKICQDLF